MFIVAVMAANATEGLDSESAAGFGAAYAGMRLVMVLQYLRVRRVPGAERMATRSAVGYSVAALIWIGSAFLATPLAYAGWGRCARWYFDGAGGACERLVEDESNAGYSRFGTVRTYPCLLGIGIAGIGLQKLINTDPSVRLNGAEMAVLTCSISAVTMMLVLIQAAGERGSSGGGWLITAQIASALALPFASDELARLPLVGAALLFVIYCAAQAAVAHRLARAEAPEREETGSRNWQRRRNAGAGVRTGVPPAGCDYLARARLARPCDDSHSIFHRESNVKRARLPFVNRACTHDGFRDRNMA